MSFLIISFSSSLFPVVLAGLALCSVCAIPPPAPPPPPPPPRGGAATPPSTPNVTSWWLLPLTSRSPLSQTGLDEGARGRRSQKARSRPCSVSRRPKSWERVRWGHSIMHKKTAFPISTQLFSPGWSVSSLLVLLSLRELLLPRRRWWQEEETFELLLRTFRPWVGQSLWYPLENLLLRVLLPPLLPLLYQVLIITNWQSPVSITNTIHFFLQPYPTSSR